MKNFSLVLSILLLLTVTGLAQSGRPIPTPPKPPGETERCGQNLNHADSS